MDQASQLRLDRSFPFPSRHRERQHLAHLTESAEFPRLSPRYHLAGADQPRYVQQGPGHQAGYAVAPQGHPRAGDHHLSEQEYDDWRKGQAPLPALSPQPEYRLLSRLTAADASQRHTPLYSPLPADPALGFDPYAAGLVAPLPDLRVEQAPRPYTSVQASSSRVGADWQLTVPPVDARRTSWQAGAAPQPRSPWEHQAQPAGFAEHRQAAQGTRLTQLPTARVYREDPYGATHPGPPPVQTPRLYNPSTPTFGPYPTSSHGAYPPVTAPAYPGYPAEPPHASSYNAYRDLHSLCPTPKLLYLLDSPHAGAEPYEVVEHAELAIWNAEDDFRARRYALAQRDGLGALRYRSPYSFFEPPHPVVQAPRDRNFDIPGLHLIPEADTYGRMRSRKAVVARPKAAAMAEGTGTPGSRRQIEVIHGKEQSVTIISDSPEPATNGKGRTGAVPVPAPAPVRRRAPARAVNGVANGNGVAAAPAASTSTRKRKVVDDDYSYAGPATKRTTKVNGKAGTSGSTATQSTIATAVGAQATEAVMNSYKNGKQAAHPLSVASGSGAAPVSVADSHDGPPWDDKDGHYIVQPNTLFGSKDRFRIVRLLGQGTFGKVVEARDNITQKKVAIKIIRAVQKYRDASAIEIRVLHALRKGDPHNQNKCIHLLETFDWRNHVCLVSELFGMSVFDFLKENKFQPFPERHIQDFARSLLTSLKYVHHLNLIHTDLKPENILLVHNGYDTIGERRSGAKQKHILKNTDIRLIDFGSATFSHEFHSSVVSTRHYRAPEIILGLGWSFPCDLFSVGCILVEFFTGDALFQTHDNLEHLAMMEIVMGKMPASMAHKASKAKGEFFKGLKIDYPNSNTSKNSRKYVKSMVPLREIIHPTNRLRTQFLDLIEKLLAFDPAKRITVDGALAHPYFREETPILPTQL